MLTLLHQSRGVVRRRVSEISVDAAEVSDGDISSVLDAMSDAWRDQVEYLETELVSLPSHD